MGPQYRAAAGRIDSVGATPGDTKRPGAKRLSSAPVKAVQRRWRKAAGWTTAVLAPVLYFGGGVFDAPATNHPKNHTITTVTGHEAPITLPDVPHVKLPEVPYTILPDVLLRSPHAASPVSALPSNNGAPEKIVPDSIFSPVPVKSANNFRPFAHTYPTISADDICKAIAGPSSTLTSDYGPRGGGFHYGQDCRAGFDKPVFALFDGRVVYAGNGYNKGFGNMVKICGKASVCAVYGHANALSVKMRDFVRAGQQVILAGNSGHAIGPHVHFEVRRYGPDDGKHGRPVNLPADPRLTAALVPAPPGVPQGVRDALRARL
ncbi:MAG: M23 family metallopeptidase [Alphaproteobacteria bacterium]